MRAMSRFGVRLTPYGHILIEPMADGAERDDPTATQLVQAFARGSGPGLLQLGAGEVGRPRPPAFTWWRGFAARHVAALCLQGSAGEDPSPLPDVPASDAAELASLVLTAPMMPRAVGSAPPRSLGKVFDGQTCRAEPGACGRTLRRNRFNRPRLARCCPTLAARLVSEPSLGVANSRIFELLPVPCALQVLYAFVP
jgi:hypothetical protein